MYLSSLFYYACLTDLNVSQKLKHLFINLLHLLVFGETIKSGKYAHKNIMINDEYFNWFA